MTTDEFNAEVKKWLAAAKDLRWKRSYTELTYQPIRPADAPATIFATARVRVSVLRVPLPQRFPS
jgi:hypothetical protein